MSKIKAENWKTKAKAESRREKNQSRWPKQKAARQNFPAQKGLEKSKLSRAACLSGKYPGTRNGGRRYSFPYPTETSHSQVVAALRFGGRIKRMLMSSMKDCPPSPQPHSLAIRRWNGGIEGAAWEQDVGEARREVKHEKGSRNESLEA